MKAIASQLHYYRLLMIHKNQKRYATKRFVLCIYTLIVICAFWSDAFCFRCSATGTTVIESIDCSGDRLSSRHRDDDPIAQ